MKNTCFLLFLFLVSISLQAQFKPTFYKKTSLNQNMWSARQISMNQINRYSDLVSDPIKTSFPKTFNVSLMDTMKYNMYGDLLNDNPLYNEKSSLWMVVFRVTMSNISTFLIDRYIFNYNFSRVGFNSWNHNIKTGWEWDKDRFGMNYFFPSFFRRNVF